MRILIAHNRYQQPGGEDSVVQAECDLLRRFGEDVYLYERSNHEVSSYSIWRKISFLSEMNWSRQTYREIKKILHEFRPDVVHFHNIFFMMTPSAYYACREAKIPVVQSLHNFRLLCSNGLFLRNNCVCEECLEHSLWRGVVHRCYKKSRLITALVVNMIKNHWKKGSWMNMVDCLVVATEFARQKYVTAGIPNEKIFVKPHFVYPDVDKRRQDKGYVLYVGRLSPEKGVDLLLRAWETIDSVPLKIMGSGPSYDSLRSFALAHNLKQVEFLGYLTQKQYNEYMKGAKFIVVPSICYENFPRVIAEAYAFGIPVLASRLGTLIELVEDKVAGVLFEAGNVDDLREKSKWMASQDELLEEMSKQARRRYEEKYSSEKNYVTLKKIYGQAIQAFKKRNGQEIVKNQRPKEFKKYAKNTGYLFLEKAVRMVFMLTIWAYVARYLGPAEFGILNYALSFVFIFQIFADLGLEPIVVRQLVENENQQDLILGSAFILKLTGSFLAVMLIFIITALVDISFLERMVIRLISLQLIFDSARVIDYYFQSKVNSKYTVFCLLSALLVSAAVYLILIRLKLPLFYFASIIAIESFITAIGLFLIYSRKVKRVIAWKINFEKILSLFKHAWPLIITGFAVALYMRIDQIMIESMLGSKAVGYYSSAVRISEAFYFIPLIISSSFFPAIVSARNKEVEIYHETVHRYLALLFWVSFFICVFIAMLSKSIIHLIYGPLYGPAANVLSVHIWASLFTFLGVGVSKWMISESLQFYNMLYAIFGVSVNISLNLLLIPRLGIMGAAWATVLTYFFVVVVSNLFYKKTRSIFSLQLKALNPTLWYRARGKRS